ncbi:MAG TPA: gamma-glutamylcyclotransferase family protein [Candidatus Limnocylindria bacterium]
MTDREPDVAWRIPLAVYGTLRRGDRNHRLIEDATFLGTGSVEGSLHHVSVSPARAYGFPVLLDGEDSRVTVELYALASPDVLDTLDALENYDAADEGGSEFLRRIVRVFDGPVDEAQIYRYNGPTDVLGEVIGGGDWLAFELPADS